MRIGHLQLFTLSTEPQPAAEPQGLPNMGWNFLCAVLTEVSRGVQNKTGVPHVQSVTPQRSTRGFWCVRCKSVTVLPYMTGNGNFMSVNF